MPRKTAGQPRRQAGAEPVRDALRDALHDALPATVALLQGRRANEIPAGYIDAYVGLDWLEWHGGGLRVTTTGENICRQQKAKPTQEA
jgi:hypothetical protein